MAKPRASDAHIRVAAVVDAVRGNLHKPWTVAEMAAVVGVSDGQLRRLFAVAHRRSPQQFLIDLRLEIASTLLADPALRIKEIQAHVGIADSSHFCRDFRARYGVSPTEYRAARLAARAQGLTTPAVPSSFPPKRLRA